MSPLETILLAVLAGCIAGFVTTRALLGWFISRLEGIEGYVQEHADAFFSGLRREQQDRTVAINQARSTLHEAIAAECRVTLAQAKEYADNAVLTAEKHLKTPLQMLTVKHDALRLWVEDLARTPDKAATFDGESDDNPAAVDPEDAEEKRTREKVKTGATTFFSR